MGFAVSVRISHAGRDRYVGYVRKFIRAIIFHVRCTYHSPYHVQKIGQDAHTSDPLFRDRGSKQNRRLVQGFGSCVSRTSLYKQMLQRMMIGSSSASSEDM